MSGAPGVSVVVPTKDSNDTLPTLFRSLDRARAELPVPSEVIVVDDSGRSSRTELERLCALHDVRLVPGGPNVGAKRNLGVAAAGFDVVLFVDSDCQASPALLLEHWTTCTTGGAGACAGPVQFVGPRSWLWPALELLGFAIGFRAPAVRPLLLWAPTANLSVRRRGFEAIGGFDETLPSPGGSEDVDLGIRLFEHGTAIHGNPEALVQHSTSTWNSMRAMLVRLGRYGRSEPCLLERHPGRWTTSFPGHLTLVVAGAVLWSAIGLAGRGAPDPLLAPLWIVAYLAAWAGRVLRYGRPEPTVLRAILAAMALEMTYEAGRVAACWRRGHPGWTVRRIVVDDGPPPGEWVGGSERAWCSFAASALCALAWIGPTR